MEAIVGLCIGLAVGAVVVWLAMKSRAEGGASELKSEVDLAQLRLDDSERVNAQLREDADNWQNQAMDGREKAASLESRLFASQQAMETATRTNEELTRQLESLRQQVADSGSRNAHLRARLEAANKRLAEQTDIESALLDRFKVMATEVIDSNSEKFLASADEKVGSLVERAKNDFALSKEAVDELVRPLSAELKRMETTRARMEGGLKQQIESLSAHNLALERETRNLTTALKRPEVRGAWGEIQLRRVVELAGMAEHCDYQEQVSIPSADGSRDRPDMIVRMPSNRTVVIDAKTPMNAYIEAIETDSDDDRETLLARHASQVKDRAAELSRKAYWDALDRSPTLDRSPEFVVMFLPGEFLLQPALERDPQLFDRAMRQKVIIATPNTLMALLKTVEMGWKEARLAENAREIQRLGAEMYDRLAIYADHFVKVGASLSATVNRYNDAVGSFDGRLSVTADRFKELGVPTGKDDVPEMKKIDAQVRQTKAALPSGDDADAC